MASLAGIMLGWALVAPIVEAAELVMFERSGCVWCRRWDTEVGGIYPKTAEGKSAPLRRVSLDQPQPEATRLSPPVFFTPTFVLMEDGRELGRITGYMGEDMFWGLLGKMLARPQSQPVPAIHP